LEGGWVSKKTGNPIDTQVGNRVRIRRMLVGLSQEQLGDRLGLTFQQVQKYEKGTNRIGAGRLFEISCFLGVPISFFYEGLRDTSLPKTASAGAEISPSVMAFVASGEGLQLSRAFKSIKDRKVRKRILDLVRSLSEDQDGD
jgi:transcriptional regulator with XRE-family HTH domain